MKENQHENNQPHQQQQENQENQLRQQDQPGSTLPASEDRLVEQKGEIKNNDHDPGAGNQSLANEAGGKAPR